MEEEINPQEIQKQEIQKEQIDDSKKTGSIRDERGRYLPGCTGNPLGNTRGSKHKAEMLKEKIFEAALTISLDKIPVEDLLKVAATLCPKESKVELTSIEPIKIEIVHGSENKVQPETKPRLEDTRPISD